MQWNFEVKPLNDGPLKQGTLVAVSVKDECTDGEISRTLTDRFEGRTPSGVRVYDWSLPREMTINDLTSLAEADSCVELVSESNADPGSPPDLSNDETGDEIVVNDGQDVTDDTLEPMFLADPKFSLQAHLRNVGWASARPVFYDATRGIRRQVVIAVIDSGVKLAHEDIRDNLWKNRREIPGNRRDDDRNGYVDDVYGFNFASRIADPNPQITSANSSWQWSHGTKVAGLAAAVYGNGRGGTGVMGNAKIMALNAMGRGSGFAHSNIANAIRYAVDNGASVVNLSLGGSTASAAFQSALRYAVSKGVVVVAAAGNESSRIGTGYSAAGLASGLRGLISIGNYKAADWTRSSTSNYSPTYVELGAPGTNTTYQGLYTTSPTSTGTYGYFSGTSAATPVAAGGAALAIGLLRSRGYAPTAATIESLLLSSARKVSALKAYFKDGNALNLFALAQLIDRTYPPRTTTPANEGADSIDQPGDLPVDTPDDLEQPEPTKGSIDLPSQGQCGA